MPSTLHQTLVFWNDEGVPMYIPSDGRYFAIESEAMTAQECQSGRPTMVVENTLSLEEASETFLCLSTKE